MQKKTDYNLLPNNTFGINAKADIFMEYDSVEDLQDLMPEIQDKRILHIGGGSNLLFTDDFHGVILHSRIKGVEVVEQDSDHVLLKVGAAVVWDQLVELTVEKGWYGIENLSLIPGETGAAAVQNIGAYGVEAKDVIQTVHTVDLKTGEIRLFQNAECQYAYRHSIFKAELKGRYAVTHVTIRLSKIYEPKLNYGNIRQALGNAEVTAQNVRKAIIDMRNEKLPDPKVLGNAGSFFMNPVVTHEKYEELKTRYPDIPAFVMDHGVKIPAGWLIEKSGWKGKALGKAAVHDKQALVLVNLGGADATDIVALSDEVRKTVSDKFGIEISPEVNFI